MAFRFWRRIKIAPGVTLNLSKAGGSLSFGPRGARVTVGPRGRRASVGIPGSGLFYTTSVGRRDSRRGTSGVAPATVVTPRAQDRLTLGFFQRLVTPEDERELVDGCRELAIGNERKALEYLRGATHLADGAYLAGFLSLKTSRLDEAEKYLLNAAANHTRLGRYFAKYGIASTMSLPITDELVAHVRPSLRGVLLALVELYQRQNRWDDAVSSLGRLRRLEPDDPVVRLSLAEILLDAHPSDRATLRKVIALAEGLENRSPIEAALLLYRGRAFRSLGLPQAACEVLSKALRRRKGRSPELMNAIRYERGRAREDLGQNRKARLDFEKVLAEDSDYSDVAMRLGIAR